MLGFLSNLRDVKSALSSGMLLLFAVWLLLGGQIAKVTPGDSLMGKVATLISYLGPAATIAIITFVAYVVGLTFPFHSLVQIAISRYNGKIATTKAGDIQESRLFGFIQDQVRVAAKKEPVDDLIKDLIREIPALTRLTIHYPWWIRSAPRPLKVRLKDAWERKLVRQAFNSKKRKDKRDSRSNMKKNIPRDLQLELAAIIFRRIYTERSILAVDLAHKDDKAYDRFDKARGESEFRGGLCIPLLILTGAIAFQLPTDQFPWGTIAVTGIGLYSVGALLSRATQKAKEAQDEINSAIILGRLKVPDLQVLSEVVNTEVLADKMPSTPRKGLLRACKPKAN